MKFVFFGSADFSVLVLNELEAKGVLPSLIVTTPDKPKGRKLILTPNVVKVWAQDRNIEVNTAIDRSRLESEGADFFLVVAYGKIIKKEIFDIPKFKTLNIHPSLLPKYRGASPMISQILNDEQNMGTSIMLIDEGMDTGPVLAQREIPHPNLGFVLPSTVVGEGRDAVRGEVFNIRELESLMAHESANLLVETISKYLSGEIEAKAQNNDEATYSEKVKKQDGLLNLEDDPKKNLLKIKAFSVWPRTYYFLGDKRIVITDVTLDESEKLKILSVIPEGKKEMPYEDFLRGNKV